MSILGCLRHSKGSDRCLFHREEEAVMSVYQNRRDIIVKGLQSLGWIEPPSPRSTSGHQFPKVIRRLNLSHCSRQVRYYCSPGNGYGEGGRLLQLPRRERMHLAIQRMKDAGIRYA